MATPKIALIGLEASGKTVLTTVLAKRLSQTREQGYYLDPQGFSTITRVEKDWITLQHRDWPASTDTGTMFKLHWRMFITPEFSKDGQSYEADVHLIDPAGQDMRILFGDDDAENIPDYLRPLADYCKDADILLIALNIKDYVSESDQMRAVLNSAIIKAALDRLQKPNKRIALVFTQMDQYKPYIEQFGGFENFCKEKLTYIYNTYIANKNRVAIIGVSAVSDTEIVEMEDGKVHRVPKPNFSSKGLGILGKWLAKQVVDIAKEDQPSEVDIPQKETVKKSDTVSFGGLLGNVLTFFLLSLFAIVGYIALVDNISQDGEIPISSVMIESLVLILVMTLCLTLINSIIYFVLYLRHYYIRKSDYDYAITSIAFKSSIKAVGCIIVVYFISLYFLPFHILPDLRVPAVFHLVILFLFIIFLILDIYKCIVKYKDYIKQFTKN